MVLEFKNFENRLIVGTNEERSKITAEETKIHRGEVKAG